MIKLLWKSPFLVLTLISLLVSSIIFLFELSYDDGAVGGVLYGIMFVFGFVRYLVRELLSVIFNIGAKEWQWMLEAFLSIFFAMTLDVVFRKIIKK